MNIPPILERLLLSNEAVFKNASLGYNGLNLLYVPPGKTAVILGYEINAFCNVQVKNTIWNYGSSTGQDTNPAYQTRFNSFWPSIAAHCLYQMQIVNDNYFTAFTHSPNFSVNPYFEKNGNDTIDFTHLSANFTEKKEDLFIYVDRSIYFQTVFQSFEDFIPYCGFYNVTFQTNIQNIPGIPITFKDSPTSSNFYSYAAASGLTSSENYNPTGKAQIDQTLYNSYILPNGEQEYLRFGTNGSAANLQNPFPTMPTPPATPDTVQPQTVFVMPTINVQYALINKRASDYGITTPKA